MPADWRENLLPGSIGGAPLFISDVKTSVGRRTTVREMPGRDRPAREDLGRKARRHTVTAFVIGLDYMAARDEVIAVLEAQGPHKFVHPWQGEFSVVLDEGSSLDIQETDTEGGWARLSFTVADSGDPDGLRVTVSTPAALVAAAVAVQVAGAPALKKLKLNIGDVFAAAAAAVGAVSGKLMKVKRKVMGALGVNEAARLTDSITDLKNNANRLLNTPAELLTTISGLVAAVLSLIRTHDSDDSEPYPGGGKVLRADAALEAAKDMASIETISPPPYPGGPVNPDAQVAEAAIGKALKIAAVAGAADLLAVLPLESSKTAAKVGEAMSSLFQELLLDETTGDDLFSALTDCKAALNAHLAALAASLPTVELYTPPTSLPVLLVAYWLYGDPTRDLEIVGRNQVADPNFLPGGGPIEVLVDG